MSLRRMYSPRLRINKITGLEKLQFTRLNIDSVSLPDTSVFTPNQQLGTNIYKKIVSFPVTDKIGAS